MGVVCATMRRAFSNPELSISGMLAAFHTMIRSSRLPAGQADSVAFSWKFSPSIRLKPDGSTWEHETKRGSDDSCADRVERPNMMTLQHLRYSGLIFSNLHATVRSQYKSSLTYSIPGGESQLVADPSE